MAWSKSVHETIKRLNNAKRVLKDQFTGRDLAVDLLMLATVCHEHVLLIGPPGTAKTEIIRRFTELLDLKAFHYLLTRFTEPSELFGPLDLEEFQAGSYHIRTENMLPEAEIAFVDEVFQGSSAILNTLLTVLNERQFHNGAQRQPVPLISMIGASNFLPDDPMLKAFADRFVLRLEVAPVEDNQLEDLLEKGWELEQERIQCLSQDAEASEQSQVMAFVSQDEVQALHQHLAEVNLAPVQAEYAKMMQELRAEGVDLSDRRIVKGLKLVAGAALLRRADVAALPDFWPLVHLWGQPEEAQVIQKNLNGRLDDAGETTLDLSRPVTDILMDMETLEAREPHVSTDAAMGAHLMELNQLRRELIRHYPTDVDSRKRVEAVIQKSLKEMEGLHV